MGRIFFKKKRKNNKKFNSRRLYKRTKKIEQIVSNYEKIWDKYDNNFINSIKKVLNINFSNNLITAKVGKIPIYPRDISENCFYIGEMKDNYFVETVMHEYCHFIYFEKWKNLFKNWKIEEFDSPHIIWYLSEMAIDPILNNAEIQKVYKYKFRAYENFYKININGNNLMKTINEIYSKNTIEEAIIKTYEYVLKNEKLIK